MKDFKVGDEVTVRKHRRIERITRISRETKLYVFVPNYFGGTHDIKFRKSDGSEPGNGFSFDTLFITATTQDDRDSLTKESLRRKIKRAMESGFDKVSIDKLKAISEILYGGKDD